MRSKLGDDVDPPLMFEPYRSTLLRAPRQPPVPLPPTVTERLGAPAAWLRTLTGATDLTRQHREPPLGQRIVVSGRVSDEAGRPVPDALVEIWQANSAGRYAHARDAWNAPLDPNFTGAGRALTDGEGRYRFVTIRPGAYPWGNHPNAWRPAHIHFSLLGPAFGSRLVTQMYFPDDPLIELDPIAQAVPAAARDRLVGRFDIGSTEAFFALSYVFDIVLRGQAATPFED